LKVDQSDERVQLEGIYGEACLGRKEQVSPIPS